MKLPSADEIADKLGPLTYSQLDKLSELSGVPRATLLKIRYRQTPNPGVETVRKFLPFIGQVRNG